MDKLCKVIILLKSLLLQNLFLPVVMSNLKEETVKMMKLIMLQILSKNENSILSLSKRKKKIALCCYSKDRQTELKL